MATKINVADYIGKKYGRLTILSQAPRKDKGNNTRFFVRCDCGNTLEVFYKRLKENNTRSCGCLSKDYHANRITHGLTKHPLYLVWYHIIERCCNDSSKDYHNYGGRGIELCDEWMSIENFYGWAINNGWKRGLEIDRKNVDGNYEPSNCHFVTPWLNSINRRDTFFVNYEGEHVAAALLSKIYKIKRATLIYRIKNGWEVKKALTEIGRIRKANRPNLI